MIIKFILPLISIFILANTGLANFSVPNPEGFVLDEANIIDNETEQKLEQEFYTIQQNQNIEIGIYTTQNKDQYPIESIANQVFNAWGLGNENSNSGILYLIDPNNKQSRVELGYGIETIISDSETLYLQELTYPYFRQEKYTEGTLILMENLIQRIEGKIFEAETSPLSWWKLNLILLFAFISVGGVINALFKKVSKTKFIIISQLITAIGVFFFVKNIYSALPLLYINTWLLAEMYEENKRQRKFERDNPILFKSKNNTNSRNHSRGIHFGGGSSGGGGSTGSW